MDAKYAPGYEEVVDDEEASRVDELYSHFNGTGARVGHYGDIDLSGHHKDLSPSGEKYNSKYGLQRCDFCLKRRKQQKLNKKTQLGSSCVS